MANNEHERMIEIPYKWVKEYNSLMYDYIKSLDTSKLSTLKLWVKFFQFYSGRISGKLPVYCF